MKPSSKKNSSQRVYRGRNLLQIALPMGGIGTGCICLNGYGGLQDFSIRHAPATSAMPDRHQPTDAGCAILHLPEKSQTRLLEGPFPAEKIYDQGLKSQGYRGGGFEGLPRFRECAFRGEYPFGVVELSDPEIPLQVTITGYNPFIPLDDLNSGIPCAILEYTLRNPTPATVSYQFSFHLSHLAQKSERTPAPSAAIPHLGVYFWNEAQPDSPDYGSAALGILNGEPLIKARWFQGNWFDAVSVLWREVSEGDFHPAEGLAPGSPGRRNGGSVLVSGELAAGESTTYPVVIAWHFPNMEDTSGSFEHKTCHPYYAAQWSDARAVLRYVQANYVPLKERTQAFHDALFASTLPAAVLDAISANLGILKSPTVLRYADGSVWAWEGCFCDAGCCPGSCTHVWNYAQAMPHLFPALERTLREQELENAMDPGGHINFRLPPPGQLTSHDFHAAADGQLGGIMKVYREWQVSGDRAWLERMYPLARRSMDFCIEQWDPRHVGLLEEPHHNTYDIEFWGPDGMCTSFYLGALTAMAALARDTGHPEEAARYEAIAWYGAQRMDEQLFNGEYYQQKVIYSGLRDTSFVEMLAKIGDSPTEEERLLQAEGPKYQYGSGCLSDGVFGAWLAKCCHLESPQNPENIRWHLASIFRYNFKTSLWEHANTQRPGYALGDEAGLLLCTWPRGGKPTLPFVYSDEVWTGIEYQVASHLIAEGMVSEGLAIVEAARRRYDGLRRNPWNEYECGNYYARAMSSYALLIALSGFRYSAVTRTLRLAPAIEQEAFRCFFSTASAWGSISLKKNQVEIRVQEGALVVDVLEITRAGRTTTLAPGVTIEAGKAVKFSLNPV